MGLGGGPGLGNYLAALDVSWGGGHLLGIWGWAFFGLVWYFLAGIFWLVWFGLVDLVWLVGLRSRCCFIFFLIKK